MMLSITLLGMCVAFIALCALTFHLGKSVMDLRTRMELHFKRSVTREAAFYDMLGVLLPDGLLDLARETMISVAKSSCFRERDTYTYNRTLAMMARLQQALADSKVPFRWMVDVDSASHDLTIWNLSVPPAYVDDANSIMKPLIQSNKDSELITFGADYYEGLVEEDDPNDRDDLFIECQGCDDQEHNHG